MGDYDNIIKENIEAIFFPLLEKLLGLSISASIELKDKIQITIEREPDFLKKIVDKKGSEFILQLEFQTSNNSEMVYRMAEYKAILQRKYKLPVKQFVIYLGTSKPNMQTRLPKEEQITGFSLTNINDIPTNTTLESEIPEEIILSILTDYAKAETEEVINQIIKKLQSATKNQAELERAVQQLLVLSRLRNLEVETKKIVADMPITYDITKDGLYLEGAEQGAEQKQVQMISRLIHQGILTTEQIASVADVPVDQVLKIKSQIDHK